MVYLETDQMTNDRQAVRLHTNEHDQFTLTRRKSTLTINTAWSEIGF